MITSIYRIKTANSVYEIHVKDTGESRCRKEGGAWRTVKDTSAEYLTKLAIGPSFDVPGVVLTSRVQDYVHFVPSDEPKRTITERASTIPGFFQELAEHVKDQAMGHRPVEVVAPTEYQANLDDYDSRHGIGPWS
jgi:hypothetical protein